jgi:hypothetical protein
MLLFLLSLIKILAIDGIYLRRNLEFYSSVLSDFDGPIDPFFW